ncbi:hypothetical protein LTR97_006486 [Elasticomyces elasticus]|uniref:BTB domain-containing protein n=1 Tax=Elasticomyces elasticus TaxID=574655 RepID=A0AAN7W6E3_9PEZI|nr:hypothetical protein LTR97_006486 [Elasticomyces elasticus]
MAPHYEQTRDAANAALLTDLSTLLTSEEHTDLKIKLGDRVWNVHKAIVCARSDFFAKACKGDFKEAKDGVVEIHDDYPEVIDKMIHYIYKTEYSESDTELAPVLFNVRMVAAAEKYFVKFLAALAVSKLDYFISNVGTAWGSKDFADAIAEAYTTTHDSDRELRDTLLQMVVAHADMLFRKEFTEFAHFQDMAAKTPSFSAEVAALLAKPLEISPILNIYYCPGDDCRESFRSAITDGQRVKWTCDYCGWEDEDDYSWWQSYKIAELPVVEAT